MSFKLVRGEVPSKGAVTGNQTDGAGTVWMVVAHTAHGDIPGKAIGHNCWYAYGGAEHTTSEFSFLKAKDSTLVKNAGGHPPCGALAIGHQTDGAGTLWGVIAHTGHGNIPGKAIGNTCWYPYGGAEHTTSDFSWVVKSWKLRHVNTKSKVPSHCVKGNQHDCGQVILVLAHTSHGTIPGKAIGNNCWYPYGGAEHTTSDFSYLKLHNKGLEKNSNGTPPHNAVGAGHQNDGAGTLWCAIAHTDHGDIPAKAIGNNCWYPYGGAEHTTSNFSWVVQN